MRISTNLIRIQFIRNIINNKIIWMLMWKKILMNGSFNFDLSIFLLIEICFLNGTLSVNVVIYVFCTRENVLSKLILDWKGLEGIKNNI